MNGPTMIRPTLFVMARRMAVQIERSVVRSEESAKIAPVSGWEKHMVLE